MTTYLTILRVTGRKKVVLLADSIKECLCPDDKVVNNPQAYYDQVIDIDLSSLEPYINGPYSPDRAWKLSEFAEAVEEH